MELGGSAAERVRHARARVGAWIDCVPSSPCAVRIWARDAAAAREVGNDIKQNRCRWRGFELRSGSQFAREAEPGRRHVHVRMRWSPSSSRPSWIRGPSLLTYTSSSTWLPAQSRGREPNPEVSLRLMAGTDPEAAGRAQDLSSPRACLGEEVKLCTDYNSASDN